MLRLNAVRIKSGIRFKSFFVYCDFLLSSCFWVCNGHTLRSLELEIAVYGVIGNNLRILKAIIQAQKLIELSLYRYCYKGIFSAQKLTVGLDNKFLKLGCISNC